MRAIYLLYLQDSGMRGYLFTRYLQDSKMLVIYLQPVAWSNRPDHDTRHGFIRLKNRIEGLIFLWWFFSPVIGVIQRGGFGFLEPRPLQNV